ncbi:hypothetical protein OB236_19315 [Paenibacillus sp. WQ 127069]|uniref:HTH domain-containing protein n=1 Tax=Paenibacillus baimaensis TaxID=2982185 RepID=A0ABT2UI15_9BACL|nr:hypothetical protein [Paenibacillus sp. WQ 127069]MCU6794260.1 hypothetical protein [Paenibacillus sp. WQ 127069]
MHRILWFDEQVRYGKYPNSGHLSERFEISVRQACRDIEYLTNTLGAPLSYSAKRRGYRYEDQTYVLPALLLTAEDVRMIKDLIIHLEQTAAVFGVTRFLEGSIALLQRIITQLSYDDET